MKRRIRWGPPLPGRGAGQDGPGSGSGSGSGSGCGRRGAGRGPLERKPGRAGAKPEAVGAEAAADTAAARAVVRRRVRAAMARFGDGGEGDLCGTFGKTFVDGLMAGER